MEKYIAEAVLGLFKSGADITTLKNLPDLPPNAYAEAEYIYKHVQAKEANHKASLMEGSGENPYNFDEKRFTDDLAAEVEQAQINRHLEKNHFPLTNRLGKKGMQNQAQHVIHSMRREANDEFLQPNIAEAHLLNFNPDALTHQDVLYKYNSGGSAKPTKDSGALPGQRRVDVVKAETRRASKRSNINERAKHPITQTRKDLDKQVAEYNVKEKQRQIDNGTYDPNNEFGDVFAHLEHDIRIQSPFWKFINQFTANEDWNLFIQTNQTARFFKDYMEDAFYRWTKNKGDNWYLKTDRSNGVDVEVWELSTGKKIGVIPMPSGYRRGADITESIERFYDILRTNAESFFE